jgi:hypothetical protein
MPQYSPEVQQALARVVQVKAAHEDELFKIPGVHRISVQPKRTGGVRTAEFAIVVNVIAKKQANDIGPGEFIPPVIDGVSTDVVETGPGVATTSPSTKTDDSHYPHALGGAEIVSDGATRTFHEISSTQNAINTGKGTLGCIAINQAATDPSKKAVALTNAHVLLDVAITTTHDGSGVGQPDRSSKCCHSIDNTIGHVDHDVLVTGVDANSSPSSPPTGIDAGFVTLDPGVQWSAEIIATGQGDSITTEKVAGPHTVDETEALFEFSGDTSTPIYDIHKRGIRTGATKGWLVSIDLTLKLPYVSVDGSVTKWLKFYHQLELEPQDSTKFFALQSDSGSAVLNSASQVIGLLYGVPSDTAPTTTSATACPIAEVQTGLGVLVADSVTYPVVQTVPKPAAAAHAVTNLPAGRANLRQGVETARAELTSTDLGRELDGAIHRHLREIRGLIDRNKRTAAVWRRIGGPAWIGEVLKCLLDRGRTLPAQLEGRSLGDCIGQLAAAFQRCGSQGLADDMKCFEPELRSLAGRSYDEVFAAWRTRAAT